MPKSSPAPGLEIPQKQSYPERFNVPVPGREYAAVSREMVAALRHLAQVMKDQSRSAREVRFGDVNISGRMNESADDMERRMTRVLRKAAMF